MLRIDSPIIYTDIFTIKKLSPNRPVFKLEGWGDDRGLLDAIVVKMEMTSAVSATSAIRRDVRVNTGLMGLVDPKAKQIVLSRQEIEQLKMYADGGSVADTAALQVATELKQNLNDPQGIWIKMELQKLAKLDDAIINRNAGDKSDVRLIARALKRSGGLEKLGEIIAADLFNGNTDRFIWPGPGVYDKLLGGQYAVIQNIGNVLIACDGNGRGSPIGLDSYDMNNQQRNMTQALTAQDAWPGKLLGQGFDAQRNQFVADVIADLEKALGPRNRKIAFASTNRLGSNRKQRVLNGMRSGKDKIKRALLAARNRPNFPVGLTSRMMLLGW